MRGPEAPADTGGAGIPEGGSGAKVGSSKGFDDDMVGASVGSSYVVGLPAAP